MSVLEYTGYPYMIDSVVTQPSEIELIKRCQQGSQEAFAQLFLKYNTSAYSIAYNIIQNSHTAEDIVQETFVKVYKNIKKFDLNKPFFNWLYQIVTNLCIDYLRKDKKSTKLSTEEMDLSSNQNQPLTAIEKNETLQQLRKLIAKLPLNYRMVLVLRDIEGFSFQEISQMLKIPPATARWRLHIARKQLRSLIKEKNKIQEQIHEL